MREGNANRGYWPTTRLTLIHRLKDEVDSRWEESWIEFVNLYGPPVTRFCRRRLPAEDADEVTQRVFIRIYKSLDRFEYDPGKGRFGGWVGQITRNEVIRFALQKKRLSRADNGLGVAELVAGTLEGIWIDELHHYFVTLAMARVKEEVSKEHWKLFEATWRSEQKPGEVAASLKVPAARVHKARFIVSEKLRTVIHELVDDYPLAGNADET